MTDSVYHPNFFLIGTVKGGTTSLHRYLSQHPEVYLSPIKEVNYFSKDDIDPRLFAKDYRHDISVNLEKYFKGGMSYPIHIAHITDEKDYLQLFSKAEGAKAIGEMSLSYMLYEHAPQALYKTYPKAKLIAMLRNPAERAFSQYLMNLKQGKILEKDFVKEVFRDDQAPVKGWGANHQYLMIGKYYEQLKRYYALFPTEQIKIFIYDDYIANPKKIIREMFEFLGVSPEIEINMQEKSNEGGVPKMKYVNYILNQWGLISWAKNSLPHSWRSPFKKWMYKTDKNELPVMTDNERQILVDYYTIDILQLEKLIHRNLKAWLQV